MFDCASVYMCTHAGKCVNVDVRGCVRTSARVRAVVCARVSKYVAACGHPGHTRADARGYGCVCCTRTKSMSVSKNRKQCAATASSKQLINHAFRSHYWLSHVASRDNVVWRNLMDVALAYVIVCSSVGVCCLFCTACCIY